eukprot:6518057-Ditylum_brightwellii.AAC.1
MRRVEMPPAPILCAFNTIQDIVHNVRTLYGDLLNTYRGELWVVKTNPPSQGLGQGSGKASLERSARQRIWSCL